MKRKRRECPQIKLSKFNQAFELEKDVIRCEADNEGLKDTATHHAVRVIDEMDDYGVK